MTNFGNIVMISLKIYDHLYITNRDRCKMSFLTQDLLINFLFILLSLFLVQMFYLLKYTNRSDQLNRGTFAIFPILSLVLCMTFPVAVGDNFVWDLRWIPFILGVLYGGYKIGFFLLYISLFIRYLMGYDGFFIACTTTPIILVTLLLVSKSFLQMSVKRKVFTSSLFIFLPTLVYGIIATKIFEFQVDTKMWIQFIVIQVIGMMITTLLWEVISANFQVLQKLIKAEKTQMVSHLAASISHEVRNPLTVSRGFIQMLGGDVSFEERKKYANIALQELDRATEVINDYLTFAKPTLKNPEEINILKEIQYAVHVIIPLANMNGVQVNQILLENETYFVKGERKKFQQCLINILKNAIDAMNDNGVLTIRQGPNQIQIQDNGIGMSKEQINRLGEPYFTTKEKGTGLGMMVSFSIIKGMGGNIIVESEPGKGTCFSIKLPSYTKQTE